SESSSSGGGGRTLEAARIALTVREGSQELLVLDNASAELTPAAITANVERLRASKPGLASAALSGVDVQLSRAEGLQIERVKVADGLLSIHTRSPQPSANPAAAAEPDEETEPDDSAAPTPVAVKNPVDGDRKKSLLAVLDRLTPDAVLTLQRARIERVTDRERVPILNDVECELQREAGGALRITGKGAADASGKLNIDMKFWPADLRADGRVTLAALPLTLFVPILPRVPWYESEKSRIDAELTISAESPAQLSLEGYANLKNVGLSAERIATSPVQGFAFSIAGKGHWFPAQRRLEIETGSVGVGKAKANVKGAVELDADHYAFDVSADMPPTPCNDAVHSIPSALLGDMSGAEWRGNIAGKLRFHTDSRELDSTELKFDIKDKCDWRLVPVLADLRRFSKPFVHSVTEPDGTVFEMETGPGTESWTPIEAMSPYLVHAVLVHEDPQFFNHKGFSPVNIRNALVRDLRERRYAVGASTISMQLVKNVFLHREKTLARKIQEVLLTWWTERVMDKRDMIELYLNVIEYGPGIYGIRNAAKHYWNREPSELSPAEGVFIATILPNPKRYHAYYQKNAIPSGTLSNMRKFLSRLGDRGAFDKEATEYGLHELEHFRFARDSKPADPRTIAGTAALLPYQMQAAQDVYDTDTFGMRGVN
ncbi:MAG TPA: transglycosylase domain-containing protein, partial [Polyangiales bacterium]|nr:transglycosylase domain-containing protein [Polyangiales bacterium]